MSSDGLFQLGMGAVLLRASQTEETTNARAMMRRARTCYAAQPMAMTRGSRAFRASINAAQSTPSPAATSNVSMRDLVRAGAIAWIAARMRPR